MIILMIILLTPILFNKLKIPHLLGLIIAGAVIGPNGLNLLLRDSSIILSGTAGLLYIMFLAGIEIDLMDFRRNSNKSIIFGMYTFIIPMVLGFWAGYYLLGFSIMTSVLLASMFASHTLLAYPILSKFGVTKNKAVNIAIGGTMITDTLALLVLAVIVGMTKGEVNTLFWIRLSVSIIIFGLVVMLLFPIIGRFFFKKVTDNVSQYVFVLAMVFLAAVLAEAAGIEAIIGAFLAGLSLNRLIPHTSPLMNRVEFVGNAIFIPFFLIGVGMLVDFRAFINDLETIKVAVVMTVVASFSKFAAAWLTQKSFKFSVDQRHLIFGLSNAQAAATLAAVLVGYNIILGETETGAPIRLLNDSVLNGTIVMILVTCTIATFVAQKGARNIHFAESPVTDDDKSGSEEKILIPISNPANIEELINLSTIIKSKNNTAGLFALSIINSGTDSPESLKASKKMLEKAVITGAATDTQINPLLRYDLNVTNGITSIIKEQNITDLIMGLHEKKAISESFLGNLTEGVLNKCNTTTFVYRPVQPIATVKRHIVIIPQNAELEIGFPYWIIKLWNIARNTGAKLIFYASESIVQIIQDIHRKHPIEAEFKLFYEWDDFLILSREIKENDCLLIVLSRDNKASYHEKMARIPNYLNKYFNANSFILVYPLQAGVDDSDITNLNNASLLEPLERLDEIGKTIFSIFKRM
jgi:Kef-type K+ transport system membrane component KefB/nucleotide-binding universal stress UspA family protein